MTNGRMNSPFSEACGCLMMREIDPHTHPNKTPLRSSLWLVWVLGQPVFPPSTVGARAPAPHCCLCVPGSTVWVCLPPRLLQRHVKRGAGWERPSHAMISALCPSQVGPGPPASGSAAMDGMLDVPKAACAGTDCPK